MRSTPDRFSPSPEIPEKEYLREFAVRIHDEPEVPAVGVMPPLLLRDRLEGFLRLRLVGELRLVIS